ncbi:Autophagy-related protein 18f [Camellia lanceoleosa]|uniref:Autophagy-related protein 18f n=1 Tax=Camellia lanceoleosa TaxID=1840588 RepID=A0ACC0HDY8_9ERIC|nr:Autophagy-related protein 18f [Camellia lanceoleosa]
MASYSASTVASTVQSAVLGDSAIVEKDSDANHYQVLWAGFDKLEWEGSTTRQVLLLGYRSGFQVWDVEEADNVRDLVSRHDGPVSFMQVLPKPIASNRSGDKFGDSRLLLAICADESLSGDGNGNNPNCHYPVHGGFMATVVWFYSLISQSHVNVLKFRSAIYLVRCSTRVVVISQATQIHCLDAATLEREYTILTNPIVAGYSGFGGIGCGPLAVGPRWLAYGGVAISNSGSVSPQHLTPSVSFPGSASNGSLVAHYAKESSKQLAAGIVTLGDMGYKKLSRYYSELLPESNNPPQSGNPGWKVNGTVNGQLPDAENVGMVYILFSFCLDIVSKSVIAQFRAHKSPISSICFNSSGTPLVTASIQGHNINVFQIMSGCDSGASYAYLYRLQRFFRNALSLYLLLLIMSFQVIQDISFSDDSHWIMISSLRGTSHLFAISPSGGSVNFQSPDAFSTCKSSGSGVMTKPVVCWPPNSGSQMLSQQSIVYLNKKQKQGWRSTVSGAAATATDRMSSLSGAIASAFHNCQVTSSLKAKYHLLVFSPSRSMIQYALRASSGLESATVAIQNWNICQKQNHRERADNIDMYGESGNSDNSKIYPERITKENGGYPDVKGLNVIAKICPEERHHIFISEAELQIYFQFMTIDEEGAPGREIEIERIPTRMIEARSKNLIPVFESLPTPKFQRAGRTPASNSSTNGQFASSVEICEDESSMMEAQVSFVKNNTEGMKLENQSEDEGDEFD